MAESNNISLILTAIPIVFTLVLGYLIYRLSKIFVSVKDFEGMETKIIDLESKISKYKEQSASIKDKEDLSESFNKILENNRKMELEISVIKEKLTQRELSLQETIRNLETNFKQTIKYEMEISSSKMDSILEKIIVLQKTINNK